jgi:hypothetical protein
MSHPLKMQSTALSWSQSHASNPRIKLPSLPEEILKRPLFLSLVHEVPARAEFIQIWSDDGSNEEFETLISSCAFEQFTAHGCVPTIPVPFPQSFLVGP